MLESTFYSNHAISYLILIVGRLPNIFGRRPTIFENCFELPLTSPTNVIKQVLIKSCYITTFPGGGGVGGGGGINNKANSVKFQLKMPV